jgi:glycosyltransferase involved in cell wall biosynthesis
MNSSIQLSFICFSVNNWEKRMARKQQLMLYLSKKPAIGKVVYVEPPVTLLQLLLFPFSTLNSPEKRKRWKRALLFSLDPVAEKLYLYTPLYYLPFSYRFQPVYNINLFLSSLILKRRVKQLNLRRTVIWLYHPFDYSLLRWFRARMSSVFDWAEEWADYFIEFSPARRKKIAEQEKKIVQKVDVVFTVSKALYDKACAWNDNTYQLFDGTAAELFLSVEAGPPAEMQTIPKPVIGYIGTSMERFDDGLIASLSEELPDASIVLIGDVHRHRIDISALEKRNNVFFLGGKHYRDLPAYVNNFDVCIMPYKEGTFISPPTKVFDYFASGKPVVSLPFPEHERFSKYLTVARNKAEFIARVKDALTEQSASLRDERIAYAIANSWEARTDELIGILKTHSHLSTSRLQ